MDAEQLGALLTACWIMEELQKPAMEEAIRIALTNVNIRGWTLVRHGGNSYVESEVVLQLLQRCPISDLPIILPIIANAIGNISEERYRKLCAAINQIPQEDAIKKTGATVSLRKDNTIKS